MSANDKTCQFCKQIGAGTNGHLDECPFGSPVAIEIYQTGRAAGMIGSDAAHPEDPTYMFGYQAGKDERLGKTFPEDAPVDRPRNSFPSVTELELALHERRDPPPVPSGAAQAFDAGIRELQARSADPY